MGNGSHLSYGLCLVVALHIFVFCSPESAPAQEPVAEDTILGAPPAFDLSGETRESLWVDAETRLYRQPARRSPILTTFGSNVEVPVLERRPGWARIRFDSWQGWVPVVGEVLQELVAGEPAPEGPAPEEPAPEESWWVPRVEADLEHLERARRFLTRERVSSFGAFQLYTDLEDDELLAHLTQIVEQLPGLFTRRFGLEARVDTSDTGMFFQTVVIYQADDSYRAYIEEGDDPITTGSLGHAIGGLAVLAVGERSPSEVRHLLIHELTHVLTYHTLGPDLPPWLNEGMADDLAYNRVNKDGVVVVDTLDSWRTAALKPFRQSDGQTQFLVTTTRGGPRASLEDVQKKWKSGKAPALESLVGMPPADFMMADQRQLHYAMSTFLMRYLLSAEEFSRRFQAFIQAVAAGNVGDGEELMTQLETNWSDLESGFTTWLGRLKKKR